MAKKAESTLKNMLLSLTLIAFVASLALALVNNVTKGPIEKVNQEKVANAIKKVLPEGVEYTINADTVSVTTDKGPANVMRYTAVDAEGNTFSLLNDACLFSRPPVSHLSAPRAGEASCQLTA